MHSSPHNESVAAAAHFIESERLLAALPLVSRRDRDHHLQLALVNALLAIAATMLAADEGSRPSS